MEKNGREWKGMKRKAKGKPFSSHTRSAQSDMMN
jgi:hypothetical protein